MGKDNIVLDKSKQLAVKVIRLVQYLHNEKKEFVLSKQLARSGTSIGANIHEAQNSVSAAEFKVKMSIALKEAGETEYWLELLKETDYISTEQFKSIYSACGELNKLLTSIVKTLKE